MVECTTEEICVLPATTVRVENQVGLQKRENQRPTTQVKGETMQPIENLQEFNAIQYKQ